MVEQLGQVMLHTQELHMLEVMVKIVFLTYGLLTVAEAVEELPRLERQMEIPLAVVVQLLGQKLGVQAELMEIMVVLELQRAKLAEAEAVRVQ
tara:strand:- start:301 stop:579 length:279 start_codon:yes stop_codon:yes gene_type:complete